MHEEVIVNREQKASEVSFLAERFEKAKAMIFADYCGLKVSEMTELRAKLRENGASMKVVKNRLVKRVLKERGLEQLNEFFTGPTAIASAEHDPMVPAKVMAEFAKTHAALNLKAGFMDGGVLTRVQIEYLATLPSKDVLLSRVLATMNAPATNLVYVLAAIPRQLACVIDAIRKKKEQTN